MDNIEQFLKELSELSNKYGISIGGCGCCGSPFLDEIINEGFYTINEKSKDTLQWSNK